MASTFTGHAAMSDTRLGVRWTVGDVSSAGFEALRSSILGAKGIFGDMADYVVCVNTVDVHEARECIGAAGRGVTWMHVDESFIPPWLRRRIDPEMAQGVAWKFAPIRVFTNRPELALDNDCVMWSMPNAVRNWLEGRCEAVLANDVRACFGGFSTMCGPQPRNWGSGVCLRTSIPCAVITWTMKTHWVACWTSGPASSEQRSTSRACRWRHSPASRMLTTSRLMKLPFARRFHRIARNSAPVAPISSVSMPNESTGSTRADRQPTI